MAKFVVMINEPLKFGYVWYQEALTEFLVHCGNSFSSDLRIKMIKRALDCNSGRDTHRKLISLMPSFNDKEQEIVTQFFLDQLKKDRYFIGYLLPSLKALKLYFTDEEKRTLIMACLRFLLNYPGDVYCYERIELLGFYIPSFVPGIQKYIINVMVDYVKKYPGLNFRYGQVEVFYKALIGRIKIESPHFHFFILQVLRFDPRALQDHFGFGEDGITYSIRTILEKAALMIPFSRMPYLSIEQNHTPQTKACVKYMYFFAKSHAIRELLSPWVPAKDILDVVDSFLHCTAFKIQSLSSETRVLPKPQVTNPVDATIQYFRFFPSKRTQNNNGDLIDPAAGLTLSST